MVLQYDPTLGMIVAIDDICECGSDFYSTGCPAYGCGGQWCPECGEGCDWEFEDGKCRQVFEDESQESYDRRINLERMAWGLPPLAGGE